MRWVLLLCVIFLVMGCGTTYKSCNIGKGPHAVQRKWNVEWLTMVSGCRCTGWAEGREERWCLD